MSETVGIGDIWRDDHDSHHYIVVGLENGDLTVIFRDLETGKQFKAGRHWFSNNYVYIA